MVRRKLLFPDPKGFQVILQLLFMVTQGTVGCCHIAIGACQIRMVRRKLLFPDSKGFQRILQRLFMVTQGTVGCCQIVTGRGQFRRIWHILFSLLQHPQMIGQGHLGLSHKIPIPSGKECPCSLPVIQSLRCHREALGELEENICIIEGIKVMESPESTQESPTIFITGLQLSQTYLPDHRVDQQSLFPALKPAAVHQLFQLFGKRFFFLFATQLAPQAAHGLFGSLDQTFLEGSIIQTILRQEGGIPQDFPLALRQHRHVEEDLHVLVDPLLARRLVVSIGHLREVLPVQAAAEGLQQVRHAHPAPAPGQGLAQKVHHHGMAIHRPDQLQQLLLGHVLVPVIPADHSQQGLLRQRADLHAGGLAAGGEHQGQAALGQLLISFLRPKVRQGLTGPVKIVDNKDCTGIFPPQDVHALPEFPVPALVVGALEFVPGEMGPENGLPHGLAAVPHGRGVVDEVDVPGLLEGLAQLDSHLSLAHAAQSPNKHRLPGFHNFRQLPHFHITAALHKGIRQRGQSRQKKPRLGPGLPRQGTQFLFQIFKNFLQPPGCQMLHVRRQVHQIQDFQVIAVALHFIPAFEFILHGQDQHHQRAVSITLTLSIFFCTEALHGVVDLLGLVGGRYLNGHACAIIRIPVHQIDGMFIPAAPVGVLQFQTVDKIHQPCADILTGNMVLQPVDLALLLHIIGINTQISSNLIQ